MKEKINENKEFIMSLADMSLKASQQHDFPPAANLSKSNVWSNSSQFPLMSVFQSDYNKDISQIEENEAESGDEDSDNDQIQENQDNEKNEENQENNNQEFNHKIKIPKLLPLIVRQIRRSYNKGDLDDFFRNPKFDEIYDSLKKTDHKYFQTLVSHFIKKENIETVNFQFYNKYLLKDKMRLKYISKMTFDYVNPKGSYEEHTLYHSKKFPKKLPRHFLKMKIIPENKNIFMENAFPALLKNFKYYFYNITGDCFRIYGRVKARRLLEKIFYTAAINRKNINFWCIYYYVDELILFKKFDEEDMDKHTLTKEEIENLEKRSREYEKVRLYYARVIFNKVERMYRNYLN
jgi:hypothetical protein